MPAILTENLTKTFRQRGAPEIRAVDGLSLEVGEGRAFAFLGPNGAGKTTTIYLLLGLRRPTSGRGHVFGRPLGSVEARARIGFLPEAMNPKPYYTTEEMLRYCARLYGMPDARATRQVAEVLTALGLQEARARRTSRLSKGMLQRLGLAQAIVGNPDLLILDEPTSNLDPVGRRDVMRLLSDLKSRGKTIFISSHVLSEVESICDDVAIVNRGRLVRQGALAALAEEMGGVEITTRGLQAQTSADIADAGGRVETRLDGSAAILVPDEQTQQAVISILLRCGCPVLSTNKRVSSLEEIFFRTLGEGTA